MKEVSMLELMEKIQLVSIVSCSSMVGSKKAVFDDPMLFLSPAMYRLSLLDGAVKERVHAMRNITVQVKCTAFTPELNHTSI